MSVIFDPTGYGTLAFDGATLRCESCGHEWQLAKTETGSVVLDGKCPVCPANRSRGQTRTRERNLGGVRPLAGFVRWHVAQTSPVLPAVLRNGVWSICGLSWSAACASRAADLKGGR